jgi:hypothetical protein
MIMRVQTARIENLEQEMSAFAEGGYGESEDDYGEQETAIANPLDYP